jgi:hypothetical protein
VVLVLVLTTSPVAVALKAMVPLVKNVYTLYPPAVVTVAPVVVATG